MIFVFKKISRFLIHICVGIAVAVGFCECNETIESDRSLYGYDFYPLEIGQYQIYKVVNIAFTPSLSPDTSIYELKVFVSDSTVDNAGEISYSLNRLKRTGPDQSWQLDSVWTTYKNDVIATVYENNIPVIKLVFPFRERQSWDSNSLNFYKTDSFRMQDLFKPYTTEMNNYLNSITIIQEEKLDSIISLDYRHEIYAQNTGLVEKIRSKLEFCQDEECLGQKIINEGEIYSQVLIEYGAE